MATPFKWFADNRLKIVSGLCIVGDVFMGLAGAAGIFRIGTNLPDMLLTIAGFLGLAGHGIVIVWGKGGRAGKLTASAAPQKQPPSLLARPLFPWRYPVDSSFSIFVFGGLLYFSSGLLAPLPGLAAFGAITTVAALIVWLWPEAKPLFGFRGLQVARCSIRFPLSPTCRQASWGTKYSSRSQAFASWSPTSFSIRSARNTSRSSRSTACRKAARHLCCLNSHSHRVEV